MVDFESDFKTEELIARWDEYTSPARFAGSDDTMDLIFVSKRNKNRVKLIRRTRSSREPFSTVFRGKITKTEQGSKISGMFTKSLLDYAAVAAIVGLLFYMRAVFAARGDSLNTIDSLIAVSIIGGGLLLYNTRAAKRKFADFIVRITGRENDKFLSKKEMAESNNENDQ